MTGVPCTWLFYKLSLAIKKNLISNADKGSHEITFVKGMSFILYLNDLIWMINFHFVSAQNDMMNLKSIDF